VTGLPVLSVVLKTVSFSLNLGIPPTYEKSARYIKSQASKEDHHGEEAEGLVNDS
jgi:hypothetical protein